ncbi:hypothetical protein [Limnofasciculus baicalensis]|uniref:Uncharacterized protein n=1 Tax=Limnofasciculus baicalensis BBK-W-15 TaxID=2699891 RepID=A0AAE3GPF9_9CYAN|nr:hypothetical protein [Limnofasciculus baicalensis]MCP2728321.1 hypothetical protein [Limnofasciculus baicalensis BBK-W-15]
MNPNEVEVKLIEVLQGIQSDSGYDGSSIAGTMRPLGGDIEGFDSMLWPVAISMLATELGINISNDKNIFLSEDGKQRLTISESAAVVCEIVSTEENQA